MFPGKTWSTVSLILMGGALLVWIGAGCREDHDPVKEYTREALITYVLQQDRTHVASCKLTSGLCMNFYAHYTESEARALCAEKGTLYSRDEDACVNFVVEGSDSPCDYFDGGYPSGHCPESGAVYYCRYNGVEKKDIVYYSIPDAYSVSDYETDCVNSGGEWRSDYTSAF